MATGRRLLTMLASAVVAASLLAACGDEGDRSDVPSGPIGEPGQSGTAPAPEHPSGGADDHDEDQRGDQSGSRIGRTPVPGLPTPSPAKSGIPRPTDPTVQDR